MSPLSPFSLHPGNVSLKGSEFRSVARRQMRQAISRHQGTFGLMKLFYLECGEFIVYVLFSKLGKLCVYCGD